MTMVGLARKIIKKSFKDDPDFRRTYVDNVACILMDSNLHNKPLRKSDKKRRDEIASRIVYWILESE
jgi:hypothetical protein